MLKPHRIDVNSLDGAVVTEDIELQGSMDVRPEAFPLEGVHQSSLHISFNDAHKLHGWLTQMLNQAIAKGWRPPKA